MNLTSVSIPFATAPPTTPPLTIPPRSVTTISNHLPQLLKFTALSSDGGQFSNSYKCDNMLAADSNVYATRKKENINIILKFVSDVASTFVLTHFIVKAPEHGVSRFSSLIGEGLIFVFNDIPDAVTTAQFDNFDAHKYKTYITSKKQHGEPLRPTDPAAYFNMNDGFCLIQKLEVPRSGRFILIKLLRSRNRIGENIEIQYMGFRGLVGPQSFAYGELI